MWTVKPLALDFMYHVISMHALRCRHDVWSDLTGKIRQTNPKLHELYAHKVIVKLDDNNVFLKPEGQLTSESYVTYYK